MTKPLITIVIPVYQISEPLLRRCLDSIVHQTADNFEAIIIDDGSPDHCGAICDTYAKMYDNLRVIHQQNAGLSVVRNRGICEARGEWICFVDGDDWIDPETVAFATCYVFQCGDGDVLIWDEFYHVDTTTKPNCFVPNCNEDKNYAFPKDKLFTLLDLFFPVVYHPFPGNHVDIGTANARLYRRSFLLTHGLLNVPGLKRMQDNVFNLWVFEKAQLVYYCPKRLYHYTFNEDAATQKYSPQNVTVMLHLYSCMLEYVQCCHDTPEYYQRLYSRFLRVFGEIFKLNFANPQNPQSLRKRLDAVNESFSTGAFREVLERFQPTGQGIKTRVLHSLFLHKLYLPLMTYYGLSIRTRKLRAKLRRNK